MNLDKKLELAHEYFMKHGRNNGWMEHDVADAWKYADAMEVEYNKRKQAEDKNKREAVRKLLNDSGTFIEREGQHFDDLNTADSPQLGFQVDWSVAPEWASYWIKTSGKSYAWLSDKPEISEIIPHWNIECIQKEFAPSFDYQGDWKDSLRKRP